MKYVIKRTDGKFVAKPGSKNSYTTRLQCARVYDTRDAAEQDRCPGNEYIVAVSDILR